MTHDQSDQPATGVRPAVLLDGVTAGYTRNKPILQHFDLQLPDGACYAVVGPSGSGKTTLLRLVLGLLKPWRGIAELPLLQPGSGGIGYIPQNLGLVRHATVRDNVLLGGLSRLSWWRALLGRFAVEEVRHADEALAWVGLAGRGDEPIATLSGGERRRVVIARALLQKPRLLVADEFLAELDTQTAGQMVELINRLRQETGLSMLFVDHHLDVACMLADRVIAVSEGHKIGEFDPTETPPQDIQIAIQRDAA